MDVSTALVLVVLFLPILFLALLGSIQLKDMLTYNPPFMPKGCPGEAQKGLIIKGRAAIAGFAFTPSHLYFLQAHI